MGWLGWLGWFGSRFLRWVYIVLLVTGMTQIRQSKRPPITPTNAAGREREGDEGPADRVAGGAAKQRATSTLTDPGATSTDPGATSTDPGATSTDLGAGLLGPSHGEPVLAEPADPGEVGGGAGYSRCRGAGKSGAVGPPVPPDVAGVGRTWPPSEMVLSGREEVVEADGDAVGAADRGLEHERVAGLGARHRQVEQVRPCGGGGNVGRMGTWCG